ncbi:DUF4192 domain-containing protein [Kitasatospora sp. NPDC088264]|uniref:DUF4192 domain-containing protein n=1 Tax=Kitasatospora sp. NPDC088264 TaxID=3155296 RepID=UPI003445760C
MTNQVTARLRGPADLAESIPYNLGFQPENSIVLAGIDGDGCMAGLIRMALPESGDVEQAADEAMAALISVYVGHGVDLHRIAIALYRDPAADTDRSIIVDALAPLAESLTKAAEEDAIGVMEALLVSDGAWSSFFCTKPDCCQTKGTPVRGMDNPGPVGTALIVAGRTVASGRSALEAKIRPAGGTDTTSFHAALSTAEANPLPEMARYDLLHRCLACAASGDRPSEEEAAQLIVALTDREFRDLALSYSEPAERSAAVRLWQDLAARIGKPRRHLAAAPLVLLTWNSWLYESPAMAMVALREAQAVDPMYEMANRLEELFMINADPAGVQDVLREVRTEWEFDRGVVGRDQADWQAPKMGEGSDPQ